MGTGRGRDTVASTSPFHVVSCGRVALHSWIVKKCLLALLFKCEGKNVADRPGSSVTFFFIP